MLPAVVAGPLRLGTGLPRIPCVPLIIAGGSSVPHQRQPNSATHTQQEGRLPQRTRRYLADWRPRPGLKNQPRYAGFADAAKVRHPLLQGGGRWLEPSIAHSEKAALCRQNAAQARAGIRFAALLLQPYCIGPVCRGGRESRCRGRCLWCCGQGVP
jgi:hypothetical protein